MTTLYHSDQPSSIPSASGIYRITCIPTGKFYIGSAVNIHQRRNKHLYDLKNNQHDNLHLSRAWQKYGEDAFVFDVIELVLSPFLLEREQFWLDTLKPFDENGFNMCPTAGSRLGMKNSPEAIEKTRAAKIGKKRSPETIEKVAASRRGKPSTRIGYSPSPEAREKLRIANLGKKQSEETIRKRSGQLKGRKRSPEAIEKTRLKNLGRTNSPEANARISAAKQGHKHDEELYEGRRKSYILTSPEGEEHIVHGLKRFCREHNLNCSNLVQVALGHARQHKGWKAVYLD